MKKSEKEALKLKIEDTAHSANLSNLWPKDTWLGTFPSQSRSAPKALTLTMAPASLLKPEVLEPDFSIQYKASFQYKSTEPDHSPYHEETQLISSTKHIVAAPDLLLQQEVTKPKPPPLQKDTKANWLSQHEVAKIVFSTQYKIAEAGTSLQHKETEPHPLQEYEAVAPYLSRPEEATQPEISLQHGVAEPDSSTASAQHEATEPNHSPKQGAIKLDRSIQHEAAAPDPLYPLYKYEAVGSDLSQQPEATEHDHLLQQKAAVPDLSHQDKKAKRGPSLQHMTTEPSNEVISISARSPAKRGALVWLVRTPAKVNRSSVFRHESHCDSGTVDCSCCTKLGDLNTSWHEQLQSNGPASLLQGLCLLSALRYRKGHTDLCELHFKALLRKFGLKCDGPRKSLIERIDAIWVARDSWNELSSLKNTFPSWFTDAEYTAQDHKVGIGKSISTFASVSDYEKVDSEKTTTSTAGVSCSEEGMENMKIYDAMTKLADEEVTRVAHLDKGQIRGFRKHVIAGDEIAKSIGELKLLHPVTHGKNSKISYVHQYIQQSPHGFEVVLDLHNLLPFCKDEWLTAQAINGTLAELAEPLDPAIQILSAEVGYLICLKVDGSDKRPIQGHDIPNIKRSTTTIIMPWNLQNLHWIVAKVTCSNKQGEITLYDSLKQSYKEITSKKQFAIVMKEITKHIPFSLWHGSSLSEQYVRFSSECVVQKGGSNCGVYTIYNALILVKVRKLSQQSVNCATRCKEYFEAYCQILRI